MYITFQVADDELRVACPLDSIGSNVDLTQNF